MRLFTYKLEYADAADIFTRLAALPYSLWFDSARPGHAQNRVSYICWQPFEIIESKDGRSRVTNRDHQLSFNSDPFELVKERIALWGARMAEHNPMLPAFQGGAAGYFGYDLARQTETLPERAMNGNLPDLCIGLYDQVIAYDHASADMILMVHAQNGQDALMRKNAIEQFKIAPAGSTSVAEWRADCDDAAYMRKIEKVIAYLYAGDIYQACLSRRFTAARPDMFDSFAHYLNLRKTNPAPFAGYMNFGDFQIGSSSPERFLSVHDGQVETRPIKGTRRSHEDVREDSLVRDALITCEKDRAENLMITDLLRNDLSKVCERHSVSVPVLCGLESYEGLHHLVSVVRGALRQDQGPLDLMRACFPGGSITGAPKIRAMEIIDELEPHRRGPWTGSMAWMGWGGGMDSNIMIRTVMYGRDDIQIQTGGGIVADSIPAQELEETKIKAEKLFESFDSMLQKTHEQTR